jgi:DNA-binding transcriptional MerR regulator
MRLSDLSAASGVPVATVKYYLREGLLPPGRLTAATSAQYDDSHLQRLRLYAPWSTLQGCPLPR